MDRVDTQKHTRKKVINQGLTDCDSVIFLRGVGWFV